MPHKIKHLDLWVVINKSNFLFTPFLIIFSSYDYVQYCHIFAHGPFCVFMFETILIDWLVGWPVGRSVGIERMVDQSIDQLIDINTVCLYTATSEQTTAHIKRRNAVKARHVPDTASPVMSPLRARRRLEHSHVNETSPDRQEFEDLSVSLSALTRGRLHDSLICHDVLSCSPPCIAVVPNIECGLYDQAGIPHQQTGVAVECPPPPGGSTAELTPGERPADEVSSLSASESDTARETPLLGEEKTEAMWGVPSEPPPLPPKTKLRLRVPGTSVVGAKDSSLRPKNCDNSDVSTRSSDDALTAQATTPEFERAGHSESSEPSCSATEPDQAGSQSEVAVCSSSPSLPHNEISVTDTGAALARSNTMPQHAVAPPRSRVLSLSDQLARIPNIESAVSPDITPSNHSFLFRAARRSGAPLCDTTGTTCVAEPATAQLVVTSRLVRQRSSSPVVVDTPQQCIAVVPPSTRSSDTDNERHNDVDNVPSGTLFCMTQTSAESEPRTESESSVDGASSDVAVADGAEQPPVLPPRRQRHNHSPSRGSDRHRHHSPSTPPLPSGRDRVIPPEITPRNDTSTPPELPPRSAIVTSPLSPTLSSIVPVQHQPSPHQADTTTGRAFY